jgi:hypothetical protein
MTVLHKRPAIRAAFVAVVLAAVLQHFLMRKFGEPYPSLMMPVFGGTGGYKDGVVRVATMDPVFVTTDGTMIPSSLQELLSDFPDSERLSLARTFLSPLPGSAVSSDGPPVRRGYRYSLLKGLKAGAFDRRLGANVSSLRVWATQRAHILAARHEVERLECRWFDETISVRGSRVSIDRSPAGVLIIQLRDVQP